MTPGTVLHNSPKLEINGGNKQVAQQKYCSGLQTQELAGTGEAPLREAGI